MPTNIQQTVCHNNNGRPHHIIETGKRKPIYKPMTVEVHYTPQSSPCTLQAILQFTCVLCGKSAYLHHNGNIQDPDLGL